MTFLPIVERELRAAARRGGTFRVRFWAGLSVMAMAACVVILFGSESPLQLAQTLFYTVTGVTLAACLFGGMGFTADCMTEEKREGTLGLLFLTDLKGYDVVLGKLVANSVHAFYALLAVLPVIAIALLLGSFTFGHIVRVGLALLNALFVSLCAGMLASTIARSTRQAGLVAVGLLVVVTMALPALGRWAATRFGLVELGWALAMFSPVYTYLSAEGTFPGGTRGGFWVSLVTVHALGWLYLVLACVYAPRCWKDQPELKTRSEDAGLLQTWLLGRGRGRVAHRQRLLARNPFYWRAARARFMPVAVWAVLAVIAGVWIWGWAKYSRNWLDAGTYLLTALLMNALLKLGVASEATRPLSEERRDGTLELLLSTPLSVKEILHGQALALARVFLGPFLIVAALEIGFMLAGLSELSLDERGDWLRTWIAGLAMLAADGIALYWVGMWRAISARAPKRALAETVGIVLVLPWVGLAMFVVFGAFFGVEPIFGVQPSWTAVLSAWCLFGFATDAAFSVWARHILLSEFRQRAAERYATRVSWWRRLLGGESAAAGAPRAG